jgi:protein involved in polysaccharide export with SLBB domain
LKELVRRYGIVQGGEGLKRVIRVDVPALLAMDPSQDVVLRNGDVINIPEPPQGEWYIDGEVSRRGPYSLTGRKITLLQAVCAAGGLTQLAVPRRTELVRRIDDRQEEIIYVDLGKIAKGQAPDFFLQPDDLIRVGTDQGAIFLAVLRNAFRATYGFGTVYDTNFSDYYPIRGDTKPLFGGHGSSTPTSSGF